MYGLTEHCSIKTAKHLRHETSQLLYPLWSSLQKERESCVGKLSFLQTAKRKQNMQKAKK